MSHYFLDTQYIHSILSNFTANLYMMLLLKYIPQIYTIKQMQYRFAVDFGTLSSLSEYNDNRTKLVVCVLCGVECV